MFRRHQAKPGDERPRGEIELQLTLLGYALDERFFAENGLLILNQEDGFLVSGFKVPQRDVDFGLVEVTEKIGGAELDALRARVLPSA